MSAARLSKAGRAAIAEGQVRAKVKRIVQKTGLTEAEARRKVDLGYSYCGVHGWCAFSRCLECKRCDSKRRREQNRKSEYSPSTVKQIMAATGLQKWEVQNKLGLGLGYCLQHGWKPYRPCPLCKPETQVEKALYKLARISPKLADKVTTGDKLDRQLNLFDKRPARR